LAAGVSHQAVHCLISRYESRFGAINAPGATRFQTPAAWAPTRPRVCKNCGRVAGWQSEKTRDGWDFCSTKCRMEAITLILRETIVKAIDMRHAGESWKGIGMALGFTVPGIQRAIWRHLHEDGLLTWDMVESLWQPRPQEFRRSWSVKWILNTRGAPKPRHSNAMAA
jgi:ferredoxin